jgi:hypothetical protein
MAETARGFYETLKFIYEATYGVKPTITAGSTIALPFISQGLGLDENMIVSEVIRAGKRYATAPAFGNINASGDIVVPVEAVAFGYWLTMAFGAPTTTGTNPYTHVFKPVNDNPSMWLEGGFADKNLFFQWTGLKLNKMSFNFQVNNEVNATMSMIGRDEVTATATVDATPVVPAYRKFQAKDIVMKEGGSEIATAMNCTLNIEQGIAEDQYTLSGNGRRVEAPEGMLKVNGSATMLFRDLTYYNKAKNNTETSIEIILTRGADVLKLLLPEVVFPQKPVTRSGAGPVTYNIEFEAYWHDGSEGAPIVATLINDQASYAI